MKKLLLSVAATSCLMVGCSSAPKTPELPDYLHASYTVKELLSDEELSCPGYGDFDIMYIMAMPPWNSYDYECSREQAREYASNFDYLNPESAQGVPEVREDVIAQYARVPKMIAKAHEEGTPVLLCLGGQLEFIPFMEHPQRLHRLADYMVRLVELNDYDGIDLDWEIYFDKDLHIALSQDIRDQLDSLSKLTGRRYYLTSALSIDHVYTEEQARLLSASHDWINIMSYDMGGGIWYDTPYHNTPLDGIKEKLQNWECFDRRKICLGLANYGFYYKGVLPGEKTGESLGKRGRYITYREFSPWLSEKGWYEEYDEVAQVPYYYAPDKSEFVTMEKPETIMIKVKEFEKMGYRGVFWWEFHHDYTRPAGDGSKGVHPLIDPVVEYMKSER